MNMHNEPMSQVKVNDNVLMSGFSEDWDGLFDAVEQARVQVGNGHRSVWDLKPEHPISDSAASHWADSEGLD